MVRKKWKGATKNIWIKQKIRSKTGNVNNYHNKNKRFKHPSEKEEIIMFKIKGYLKDIYAITNQRKAEVTKQIAEQRTFPEIKVILQ